MSIRVPNLYKIQLGLPRAIETEGSGFFDCKLRKLFVVLTIKKETVETLTQLSAPVDTKVLENDLLFDIV